MHEALGNSGNPMTQVLAGALKSEGLVPPSVMAVKVTGAFPELVTIVV